MIRTVIVGAGGRMGRVLITLTLQDLELKLVGAVETASSPLQGQDAGVVAGVHCHAVIETNRGHDLGRVIWKGAAQADTGKPESVMGFEGDRVLRAPRAGVLCAQKEIGDLVGKNEVIATVDGQKIIAPFDGALRGLIHDGIVVTADEKVGDLDPRCEPRYCFTISDKSLAVAGGVPRPGCKIFMDGKQVGELASATYSPTLRKGIGVGYITPPDLKPGAPLEVEIHGKRVKAEVARVPFYKGTAFNKGIGA